MPDFRLETERLVLRDWREGDWAPFFRHTNTPNVMRWLGGVLDQDAQAAMRGRLAACKTEHGHSFWVVERKNDGEVLGFCGLKKAKQPGGPIGDFEVGWRLREDAWGEGYAREAADASLRAGFEQFGAPHIIALTVKENVGSWGLMRRLGMARCADLDFVSTSAPFVDEHVIVYRITREEWQATQ